MSPDIPRSVFHYLNLRFKSKIEDFVYKETQKFQEAKTKDQN